MQFTLEQFKECKEEAETFYSGLTTVRCPYFNADIHFNAKGLEHLKLKKWNKSRSQQDQYGRFKHLRCVPDILKNSKTLQGFSTKRQMERVKINKKWQEVAKTVTWYEFISVVPYNSSFVRVKIVVKEIEGGEKFFWSIIPFWKTRKGDRVLTDGDPDTD